MKKARKIIITIKITIMPLGALGMQAASEGLSAGMGLLLGGINDNRQYNQQERLQQLQIAGQKQMTDYNYQKQLEMWNATNYPAQVEQMKKAGLNVGLMSGKGGQGGQTAVATGNVQGAMAPQGGGEAMGMMMMAAQLKLLTAQADNIKADTRNKEMNTDVTGGVNVQKTKEETSNLAQTRENLKAQQALTESQTNLNAIQAKINSATTYDQISQIKSEAIGAALVNQLTKARTASTRQDIAESQSNIQVNDQKIQNMINEIMINWRRLDNDTIRTMLQKNGYNDSDPVIEGILGTARQVMGLHSGSNTISEHWNERTGHTITNSTTTHH